MKEKFVDHRFSAASLKTTGATQEADNG